MNICHQSTLKNCLRSFLFYQGNAINYKEMRQLDRKDTVLSGNGKNDVNSQFPIHPPTGERTRKTYDFTSRK